MEGISPPINPFPLSSSRNASSSSLSSSSFRRFPSCLLPMPYGTIGFRSRKRKFSFNSLPQATEPPQKKRAGLRSAEEANIKPRRDLSTPSLRASAPGGSNRRNLVASKRSQNSLPQSQRPVTRALARELANFAKNGGPDLQDLRGVRRSITCFLSVDADNSKVLLGGRNAVGKFVCYQI